MPSAPRLNLSSPPAGWRQLIGNFSDALTDMLWHGLAKDTRKGYETTIHSYESFCTMRGEKPWPARVEVIGEWIISRISPSPYYPKVVKAATIDGYIAALRSVHVDRRLDLTVFASLWLRRIIAGIRRTEVSRPTKQAFPITAEVLSQITYIHPGIVGTAECSRNINFDVAAKVAFAGLFRLGELTFKEDELTPDIISTKVLRSDVSFALDNSHAIIRLRRSKADKEHAGVNIVLARTSTPTCPVESLKALFELDPRLPTTPLFNVDNKPMTRNWMIGKLRSRIAAHQLDPSIYSGHSFRRGAAQQASDNGLTNDEIQVLGRWSSAAFERYFKRGLRSRFEINRRFLLKDSSFLSAPTAPPPPPLVSGAALLYGGSLIAS